MVKQYGIRMGVLGTLMALLFTSPSVHAKNKLDLDELTIKGELHNDDRLVMIARERNEMKNYVKFRTNFRPEMVEELPIPAPGVKEK